MPLAAKPSWRASPKPRPWTWIVLAAALCSISLVIGHLIESAPSTLLESGPIEMMQIGVLAFAAGLFFAAFLRSSDAKAAFCLIMAYGMIIALRREIPRCESAFYEDGICLTGHGKNGIVIAATIFAAAALLLKWIDWRDTARKENLHWIWPAGISLTIAIAGQIAEHVMHPGMEETLELAAYLYNCAFGLWIVHHARSGN